MTKIEGSGSSAAPQSAPAKASGGSSLSPQEHLTKTQICSKMAQACAGTSISQGMSALVSRSKGEDA